MPYEISYGQSIGLTRNHTTTLGVKCANSIMPGELKLRFFFHLHSDQIDDIDENGVNFPSLEAAKLEACRSAREMIAELVLNDERIDGLAFEIVDEEGTTRATIRFRDLLRLE